MTLTGQDPATGASRWWQPRHVEPGTKATAIRRVLELARESLSMELGYFGTFDGGSETYVVVVGGAADGRPLGPREGGSLVVDETLCWQVVTGTMGNVVRDTRRDRVTRGLLPVTDERVASYVGVPVHADGELLGMLCLVSSTAHPELASTDVALMRVFADFVALELTADDAGATDAELDALHGYLDPASSDLLVVFQPVARIGARLTDRRLQVRAVEALARFADAPGVPVEHWFDLAWRRGLGVDLELAAVERALDALPLLPPEIRLSVNASPETVASSRLRDVIPLDEAHRITVELTEHVLLDDFAALRPGLERLRATGVSLAIDDLGTGSSNLQHLVELQPDVVKVDLSITAGVETNPRRRALVAALVSFARDTGVRLVTEGVERVETARTLDRLGVVYGQGWWLSRALKVGKLPLLHAG